MKLKVRLSGNVEKIALALSGLLICTAPAFGASATTSQVLKPIDPTAAQLDAPPPPESQQAPQNANPFGSNIQGQPLNKPAAQAPSPINDAPMLDASPQDESRVAFLEQKAFGSVYSEHEVSDRLDHLEKEVFGSAKTGSLADRLGKLEQKLLGGSSMFGANTPPANNNSNSYSNNNQNNQAPNKVTIVQPPPQWQVPQNSGGSGQTQSDWEMPAGQSANQQPQQQQQQQRPPQQQQYQQPQQQFQQPPQQQQSQQQRPPQQQQYQQQYQQPPQQQYQQPQQQYQQPPQQQQQFQYPAPGQIPRQDQYQAPSRPAQPQSAQGLSVDSSLVANSLPFDANAGDYLPLIRKFNGPSGAPVYAYWTKFPFRLRLPAGSPDSWQRALETVIARWGQYVPVKMALPKEEVNAEIVWVNNLPKGLLAVTRYTIKDGQIRCWIYLLRPTYYPAEIPERYLSSIFTREMGHALGLLGKSDRPGDLMYQSEASIKTASGVKPGLKISGISARDINTLKRIYQSAPLPANMTLNEPLEWATNY